MSVCKPCLRGNHEHDRYVTGEDAGCPNLADLGGGVGPDNACTCQVRVSPRTHVCVCRYCGRSPS